MIHSLVLAATRGTSPVSSRERQRVDSRRRFFDEVVVAPPESFPIVALARIKLRISRKAAAKIGVILPLGNKTGAGGILEDVAGAIAKRAAFSFRFGQRVIVGLPLPVGRREERAQMLAQEFDGDTLIGAVCVMAKPQQVHVIGHEDVRRTHEIVAGARVEEREPPGVVKCRREPTGGPIFDVQRPMDECPAAVEFRSEARQMTFFHSRGIHSLALAATG